MVTNSPAMTKKSKCQVVTFLRFYCNSTCISRDLFTITNPSISVFSWNAGKYGAE